jgi:arylsulfatase A
MRVVSIVLVILGGVLTSATAVRGQESRPPNFVVIFCDDLGYGDVGCFGHPTISTPNLDRMAAEGTKLTSFYVAASVCTPSRAGLLTGRLPIRSGMCSSRRRVLFPDSAGGLPDEEVTIAEVLKPRGYATACVGKWHLGHLPQYLPTAQGFDSYFGIPYSNDMDRSGEAPRGREAFWSPRAEYWNVPLVQNDQVVERPADQHTITRRYTEAAVEFIRENREQPFFLYLAHSMPHVPLFVSEAFDGHSRRGLYGDVIEEIDWSVGQVLSAIREADLSEDTLVVFTSDNGPWLIFDSHGGSAGPLRDGKGCTWEGGMRVPCVVWRPGTVPSGEVRSDMASTLDLLPTFAALAGASPPGNRPLDGYDLSAFLVGDEPSPREEMFFYRGTELYAVRQGRFKAHYITQPAYGGGQREKHDPPLLYNLEHDAGERWNVADEHSDALAKIEILVAEHQAGLTPGEPQLERRIE